MVSAAYFLVAALAVAYVVRSIRTYYSLKQFGGHWSAGWSRLWLLSTQSSGEMHKRFAALNRKHGEYSTRQGFFSLPPCRNHAHFVTSNRSTRFAAQTVARRLRSRDTQGLACHVIDDCLFMLLCLGCDVSCHWHTELTMLSRFHRPYWPTHANHLRP